MGKTTAVMQRELLALFYSPVGYIVIAGFLLITGVISTLTGTFQPGQQATLRGLFDFTPYVLTIIIPAICMRLISEEYRNGTIEALMTAPLSDAQMVLGKYFAALLFYAIMIAGTLAYLVIMMIFGNPDVGASLASYFGLLLVGAAFTAYGLFASSLTANQIVAWIIGMVPLMMFVWFGQFIVSRVSGIAREIAQAVNVSRYLDEFNRGIISTEALAFFLMTSVIFLFLTIKTVETRRWR